MTHTPENHKRHQKNSDCTTNTKTASTSRAISGRKGKCGARIAANRRKQNVLLTVAGSLVTMLGLAGLGFKRRKETKIEDEKKDELIVLLFSYGGKHWKQ